MPLALPAHDSQDGAQEGKQSYVLPNCSRLPRGSQKSFCEPHNETCTKETRERMLNDRIAMQAHIHRIFISTVACRYQRTSTAACWGLCASGQAVASQTRLQHNQPARLQETTPGIAGNSKIFDNANNFKAIRSAHNGKSWMRKPA